MLFIKASSPVIDEDVLQNVTSHVMLMLLLTLRNLYSYPLILTSSLCIGVCHAISIEALFHAKLKFNIPELLSYILVLEQSIIRTYDDFLHRIRDNDDVTYHALREILDDEVRRESEIASVLAVDDGK
jgi:hypothetical protein